MWTVLAQIFLWDPKPPWTMLHVIVFWYYCEIQENYTGLTKQPHKKYLLQPKTAPFCGLFCLLDFLGGRKFGTLPPPLPRKMFLDPALLCLRIGGSRIFWKGVQPLMTAIRSWKGGGGCAALKWPKIMGKIFRRKGDLQPNQPSTRSGNA